VREEISLFFFLMETEERREKREEARTYRKEKILAGQEKRGEFG
jgi:hypothetical protein